MHDYHYAEFVSPHGREVQPDKTFWRCESPFLELCRVLNSSTSTKSCTHTSASLIALITTIQVVRYVEVSPVFEDSLLETSPLAQLPKASFSQPSL